MVECHKDLMQEKNLCEKISNKSKLLVNRISSMFIGKKKGLNQKENNQEHKTQEADAKISISKRQVIEGLDPGTQERVFLEALES